MIYSIPSSVDVNMWGLIFCLYLLSHGVFPEDPVITISNGKIRGILAKSQINNLTYYSYMGIPFAAPPVGNLRFKPPQPVENWDGILDTKNNQVSCHQTDKPDEYETEDCLYLNVYTTVIVIGYKPRKLRNNYRPTTK